MKIQSFCRNMVIQRFLNLGEFCHLFLFRDMVYSLKYFKGNGCPGPRS